MKIKNLLTRIVKRLKYLAINLALGKQVEQYHPCRNADVQ
jgi:hypothetical protein